MTGPGRELERSIIQGVPGIPGPLGGASDEACSALQGPGSFAAFKDARAWEIEYARQSSFGDYQPYAVPGINMRPQGREPENVVLATFSTSERPTP